MDSAKPCLLEILKHSIATATSSTACIEPLKVTNGRQVTQGFKPQPQPDWTPHLCYPNNFCSPSLSLSP
jgi:hypothetical protein